VFPKGLLVEGWRWRPVTGLAQLAQMAHGLNEATYRWPFPAIGVIVAGLVLVGVETQGGRRGAGRLLGLSALALALLYARFPEVVEGALGPRYMFEAVPLLIVLAAGCVALGCRKLGEVGVGLDRVRATAVLVLLLSSAYAALWIMTVGRRQFRNYCGVDVRVFRVVESQAERPAVVFVPTPMGTDYLHRFYAALGRNDPDLNGPILYARDLGPKNRVLLEARPGRRAYRWDHASFTLVPLGPDGVSALAPPPPPSR
jgi:hypothetical protein